MMILSNIWFGSNVRYMQRRLNTTWRAMGVAEQLPQVPEQAKTGKEGAVA